MYVSYDIMFRMFRRKPNPGIRIGIGVFGRSIGAESRRGIRFRSKEGALSLVAVLGISVLGITGAQERMDEAMPVLN